MGTRGEKQFIKMPRIVVKLYDSMMMKKPMETQRIEIAKILLSCIDSGKILDVGTGHGRLLYEIWKMNKEIQLFGIDISNKMIELAKENLSGIKVNLRCGNIAETNYEEDFFNIVTCTGSFYLWDEPVKALNEIYRILEPQGKVILFESHNEIDKTELKSLIKQNLKDESFFSKKITPYFLFKQLKMTYKISEIESLIMKSKFGKFFSLKKITLAKLPVWLRIEMKKTS